MQNTNIMEARAQPGWITLTKLIMCQWNEAKPTYNVCNMCINKTCIMQILRKWDSKEKGKLRGTKTSYLNNYIRWKCIVACSIKCLAKTSIIQMLSVYRNSAVLTKIWKNDFCNQSPVWLLSDCITNRRQSAVRELHAGASVCTLCDWFRQMSHMTS